MGPAEPRKEPAGTKRCHRFLLLILPDDARMLLPVASETDCWLACLPIDPLDGLAAVVLVFPGLMTRGALAWGRRPRWPALALANRRSLRSAALM